MLFRVGFFAVWYGRRNKICIIYNQLPKLKRLAKFSFFQFYSKIQVCYRVFKRGCKKLAIPMLTFFFKFGNHQTNKQQTYPLFLSVLLRCLRATTSSRARFWTRLLSSLTVRWARVSSGITSLAMDSPLVLPPAVEWAPGEHNLVFDFLYTFPPPDKAPTPTTPVLGSHYWY